VRLAFCLELVAFHHLLNLSTDLAEACVDTRRLDTGIRRCLDGREKRVIRRLKVQSKCTVNDTALHMHTKVDFENVAALQDALVTRVRRVVRGNLV